jgi:hypothetical protein
MSGRLSRRACLDGCFAALRMKGRRWQKLILSGAKDLQEERRGATAPLPLSNVPSRGSRVAPRRFHPEAACDLFPRSEFDASPDGAAASLLQILRFAQDESLGVSPISAHPLSAAKDLPNEARDVADVASSRLLSSVQPSIFALLSRSAFPITETDEKLIAAAAIIGLSSRPKNG